MAYPTQCVINPLLPAIPTYTRLEQNSVMDMTVISLSSSNWVSVDEPHTSAFNVDSCQCGVYICMLACTSWPVQSVQLVTCNTHRYCLNMCLLSCPFRLLHWASTSNSETSLKRCQWREREMTAAETWDERATALHCHVLLLCSTMFYIHLVISGVV